MAELERFKSFTHRVRDLVQLVKDHNAGIYISKENYGEGINVIGVGNIYDNDIFDGEIYRLGPVNDDKFLLDEGDIVYGESSLVLEGIARTICVGKNGAGSAFAWHTRRVKLDNDLVDSHFATLELNYHPVVRKHLMSVATQTALTGMTTDGYFSAPLFLPSVPEQKKICEVFKNLDTLITLHQRKLEKLKIIKKSMLENCFPKNGEKIPKFRFDGFSGDWEQRKFGEFTELKSASRVHKEEWTSEGVPFYRSSDVMSAINGTQNEKAFISEELYEKLSAASGKLEEGDVLVTGGGSVGNPYIVPNNEPLYTKDADLLWIKNQGRFDAYFILNYSSKPDEGTK